MTEAYPGPLHGEPLPVELYNTLYAVAGEPVDGLSSAAGLRSWLAAVRDELPVDADAVEPARLDDFVALRAAVRDALHAVHDDRPLPPRAVDSLNAISARGAHWLTLTDGDGGRRVAVRRYDSSDAADVVLGHIAERTIAILAGPEAARLRACGAPGCVLMFMKDHPRREWCSAACGNRARQARHYARHRPRVARTDRREG